MIIFISDLDLRGSGYMNIAASLCQGLAKKGHEVKVFGFGYGGEEHNFDFGIIPVPHQGAVRYAWTGLENMIKLGASIDAVIVALDIPVHLQYLSMPRNSIPYIGIFPVESGPLTASWAAPLTSAEKLFVISKFGFQQCQDAKVPAEYIEIGLDTESWRPPSDLERKGLRDALGLKDEDFLVLTVADNHERKNLSAAMQMLAAARKEIPLLWALVTRLDFRGGWKFADLANEFGVTDIFMPYEKGLDFKKLWALYAAADAFLLTSKAEGLCMPILEAMACGVPVIATNCTAITEHLENDRGLLIEPEYQTRGVWGNSIRSFASIEHGANQVLRLATMTNGKREKMIAEALSYVRGRIAEGATEQLNTAIEELIHGRAKDLKEESEKVALF